MSRINAGLYSSDAHDWMTPPDFIENLLDFIGIDKFDLDPCCTQFNIPAHTHFTEEEDGLSKPWFGTVYMNPPYGNQLKLWVKKAYEESLRGVKVWGLIPARPDTRYWHDYVFTNNSFVFFLQGRLKFLKDGVADGTAPFPTALVYWAKGAQVTGAAMTGVSPLTGTVVVRKRV